MRLSFSVAGLLLGIPSFVTALGRSSNSGLEPVIKLNSRLVPGASLSYKKTALCETSSSVKSYSGYVNLQDSTLNPAAESNASISIFFWFFEARNNAANAPLAVYLAGGPGDSSTFAAMMENGPCTVNTDSNSTTLNPWSFNTDANVLYIDQPNQVGFSYDTILEGFFDSLTTRITVDEQTTTNQTMYPGKFPSQNSTSTSNTTGQVAQSLWYFAQVWFKDFPEYTTTNKFKGLWGNSYAGTYIPAIAAFLEKQNQMIACGQKHSGLLTVSFDTIGITNGCVDQVVQGLGYAEMAYNNTYGFQAVNESVYHAMLETFSEPGGCEDMVQQCRDLAASGDGTDTGSNSTVNMACSETYATCAESYTGLYSLSGRSFYDMAATTSNPYSRLFAGPYTPHPINFLNQEWVQKELGVPLNFTASSSVVSTNFVYTGDALRADMSDLESLVNMKKTVALIYGDRDYQCNWIGGETLSLALKHPSQSQFEASGYRNIVPSVAERTRGVVRQYEGLSFARVFDAGHHVSAYEPETVHRIFNRAMSGKDIATGTKGAAWGSRYASEGLSSSFGIKNHMPDLLNSYCNVLATDSCSEEQLEALAVGQAVVKDFTVIEPAS